MAQSESAVEVLLAALAVGEGTDLVRERVLSSKADDLEVGIPKFRKGSFFPEIIEPRRHIDPALYAVVT